jgi:homoserine O-succinyltransferase/O-acetyltransferase
MPASLNANNVYGFPPVGGMWLSGMGTFGVREQSARCLTIGLINNMPDGALETTERQFLSLLNAASGTMQIRLLLFSFSGIIRSGEAATRVRTFYAGVDKLWNARLDGLIVTGREPMAPRLSEEAYWKEFTRVVDWARKNTYSSIWSCLAAHAAILYTDGIPRVRKRTKQCGIFDCAVVAGNPLTAGIGPRLRLPHSRWNGLSEWELRRRGFCVLTRSEEVGVDAFTRRDKSLFVYFQGHPEYEANSLLLEYRRDVARYWRGEAKQYPEPPKNYFDKVTLDELSVLQREATRRPRKDLLAEVYGTLLRAKIEETWRPAANRIYRNWLEYVSAEKQKRMEVSGVFERELVRGRPTLVVRSRAGESPRIVPGKTAAAS